MLSKDNLKQPKLSNFLKVYKKGLNLVSSVLFCFALCVLGLLDQKLFVQTSDTIQLCRSHNNKYEKAKLWTLHIISIEKKADI